jgi:hypothetical protein
MVVCDMQEKGVEALYTRDQSYNACDELDEYPFGQCKKLFHEIYKSHRDRKDAGGRGDKAFNPLKIAAADQRIGLDSTTEVMVKAIYEIVHESCEYAPKLDTCDTNVYRGRNLRTVGKTRNDQPRVHR